MRYLITPLFAAFWAALAGILEGRALEAWFGIELHRTSNYAELALNYGILALVVALITLVGLNLLWRIALRRESELRFSVEFLVGWGFLGLIGFFYLARQPAAGLKVSSALVFAAAAILGLAAGWGFGRAGRPVRVVARGAFLLVGVAVFGLPIVKERLTAHPEPGPRHGRPNVLLVLVDTLRPDFLSCYGYDMSTSPHIDMLAAGGVRFDQVTAQASWTLPSTASILTGLYPSSHGAVRYGEGIADQPVRLAEVLHDAGYRTGAFTENWYITPRNGFGRGFESYWGYWFPWVEESTALHRILRRGDLPLLELTRKQEFPENATDPDQLNWDAKVTVNKAMAWLDHGDGRPWFAYLHLMGPHGPYGPPQYLLPGSEPKERLADHPKEKGGCVPLGAPGEPVDAAALALMKQLYAADIRYVDEQIGRLYKSLRERGVLDSTLIVFTSDHGEEFYEHSGWNHGASAYEEVVHVPLIVSWLGRIPQGHVVSDQARSIDIMPTVLDLAGCEPPPLPGHSLRGTWEGNPGKSAERALVEACALRPPHGAIDAAVEGTYKLIRIRVGDEERRLLFDLVDDPAESIDLANVMPAVADSLTRLLDAWKAQAAGAGGKDVRLDPATRRLLESLGYIN